MGVDLIKALTLLWALVVYGLPDGWDVALGARLSLGLDGVVLEVGVDPVGIYRRPPPWPWDGLCGLDALGMVFVNPNAAALGCADTLDHELGHVWQYRAYGLAYALTYHAYPGWWEPSRPWEEIPHAPRTLLYPLIRLTLPL
ncbi:hypothetical protein phiMa_20 [Thermus phage phiMa]|nr:hypothetical protein phiMa_20 [Thermus phage phiMa]